MEIIPRFLKTIKNYKFSNVEMIDTIYHDLHLEKVNKLSFHVSKFIRNNLNKITYKAIHDDEFKNIPKRFQTHEMTLNKYLR